MRLRLKQKVVTLFNIVVNTISNYENDEYEPNTEHLFAMPNLYVVSIDYVLGNQLHEIVEIVVDDERKNIWNNIERELNTYG